MDFLRGIACCAEDEGELDSTDESTLLLDVSRSQFEALFSTAAGAQVDEYSMHLTDING